MTGWVVPVVDGAEMTWTVTIKCRACGHAARFDADEPIRWDDPRFCQHGSQRGFHGVSDTEEGS